MAWIFDSCTDPFGNCIRQYCVFGVSILIFLFCLYSILMTIRKQTHYSFEVIPLIINTVAAFTLICVFSQFEQENIHLIMELIEIYSYSLLAYSYAGLYLLGTKSITKIQFRKIKIGFILFSVLILAGIIILVVLELLGKIKCQESHGIGNLILSLLQIPIYALTFGFVIKTKQQIKSIQQFNHEDQGKEEIKLLGDEDQYISVRYKQANAVIFFFTLSIVVHIGTVVMFFVEKTGCSETGLLQTQNIYEVVMFSLFDFATILPHVAIPIILYAIPQSHYVSGNTIVITPKKIIKEKSEFSTNFLNSQFEAQGIKDMIRRNSPQK